jgi:serine protease
VSAIAAPEMLWLGNGAIARLFLGINALLCFGLAALSAKAVHQRTAI